MSATIIVTYLLVVCPGANALASNRSFTTKQIIQLLHFALFRIIESMTGNVVVIRKQMAFRRQFLFILGLGLLLFLHVVSITHAFFVKPRPFSTKSTYLNSASTSCYTWPQAQVSPSPLVSAARRGTLHWTKQSYPSALRAMGSSEVRVWTSVFSSCNFPFRSLSIFAPTRLPCQCCLPGFSALKYLTSYGLPSSPPRHPSPTLTPRYSWPLI